MASIDRRRPSAGRVYVDGMALPDTAVNQFLEQVGRRLRNARAAKGLSLQQVADHLGIKARATVGHWETGHNPVDLNKLYRLARLYGTTVPALVTESVSAADALAILQRELAPAGEGRTVGPVATREVGKHGEPALKIAPAPAIEPSTPARAKRAAPAKPRP